MPEIDNGLIILDKPYGHVAHEITTYVKKLLGVRRSGHAGTLDPDVSGVMPIAIGKATKLLGYIAGRKKTYVCIMKIKDRSVSDATLRQLFKDFTGELTQTPPKKSAVRKVPRKRIVYYINFLERKDNLVLFEAEVDAGTYIRTLCEDMGKKIGGARMEELRRIAVGKITEQQAVKLQDLIDAVWLYKHGKPQQLEKMIKKPDDYIELKKVVIRDNALQSIKNGAQLMAPAVASIDDGVKKDELVKLYSESGKFAGIGKAAADKDQLLKMKTGLAVSIERMHL
ncbi:MAG: RNA-guided pseudouridylation complex pseudouridine synthase subunit Cbf5 [Candidatus Micrarchaeota archaeon]